MKDSVSSQIFARFPGYIRGLVVVRGADNTGENGNLLRMLREVEDKATRDPSLLEIKNHPRLASWRAAYTAFGTNPNKFYSSIESLARRARRGDQVPYINTLVALFNYFSIKHMVPSGGDDLDRVDTGLCLTPARGDELFTPLGCETLEHPDPGEVVFIDHSRVMCRRWNWRQGDQTKLLLGTTNVAINIDCLPPVTVEEATVLTTELAGLVQEFCGGLVSHYLLEVSRGEVDI